MANNYTLSSFSIPVKDKSQATARMEAIVDWVENGVKLDTKLFGSIRCKRVETELRDARENGYLGFDWIVDGDDVAGLGFWHQESIDMEVAVVVAQLMLDLDDNDDIFVATWANTCDKPRIDEFGGGAVAFGRNHSRWMTTYNSAEEMKEELEKLTQ